MGLSYRVCPCASRKEYRRGRQNIPMSGTMSTYYAPLSERLFYYRMPCVFPQELRLNQGVKCLTRDPFSGYPKIAPTSAVNT